MGKENDSRQNRPVGRIKDWPEQERPRERLILYGSHVLSDAELLAVLLGTGTRAMGALDIARLLMMRSGTLQNMAARKTPELMQIAGIGKAGAARIAAAFELGRRVSVGGAQSRKKIRVPSDVARLYLPRYKDLQQERFGAVLLDSGNKVIRDVTLSLGILNASLVHPREVFKAAVENLAAGIILMHNHPSGDPAPSEEDRRITFQLLEASRIMGIPVLDHVILAGDAYYSFAENGLVKQ